MRKLVDRVGVILFWLLMLCAFLISVFRKQQATSAPSLNRINPAPQEPQSSQPGATPHPEPLVDSGMIEVALVIATIGFLLYQFGDQLDVADLIPIADLGMKQIGSIVVFAGIAAGFLLHSSFWEVWVGIFNRRSGRLTRVVFPVLMGHIIIFIVLAAAMVMSAYFALGYCGAWLAALIILALAIMSIWKS